MKQALTMKIKMQNQIYQIIMILLVSIMLFGCNSGLNNSQSTSITGSYSINEIDNVTNYNQLAFVLDKNNSKIFSFWVNQSTGQLWTTPFESISTGEHPQIMAITPNSKFIYIAVDSGDIEEYAISSSGQLSKIGVISGNQRNPKGFAISDNNLYMVVAGSGDSTYNNTSVIAYSINPGSGHLTWLGRKYPNNDMRSGLAVNIRHYLSVTLSGDRNHLYVGGEPVPSQCPTCLAGNNFILAT